jgi:restriction system-associated AAA family ATPase
MKLLRLQINNSFRSLPAGFNIEFRKPDEEFEKNLHEPICLVGVNGSGKSNVLEVLSEIFNSIDQYLLNKEDFESTKFPIDSFEIEYVIPFTWNLDYLNWDSGLNFDAKNIQVKISKAANEAPIFQWINGEEIKPITESKESALPQRIIGYSSGQNELLSIPFYKARFSFYKSLLKEQKSFYKGSVRSSRLQYADYEENASILLSNFLMAKDGEVAIIQEKLLIDNIADFEIIINRNQKKRGVIKTEKDIEKLLSFLKSNASSVDLIDDGINRLNFIVTPQLKKEFQDNFLDASGLYSLFKQLSYLNMNAIKKSQIDSLLDSEQEIYENYKIGDFAPEKKLFQISSINIRKNEIPYPISYKNLSDGEHQFIHIIGTLMMMKEESALFLFDEPETHFNPRWKYEYTETFKKVTSELKSQILLTTHDPVLISGLAKENVIVFNKPQEGIERTYKPEKELRGMGVDAILMSDIFGFDSTIDIATKEEIVELRILQLKRITGQLNEDEQARYSILYEKLRGIDFAEPLNDPMFRDFLIAKESLSVYSKPFLTEEEEKERENISKQILIKIKAKYNQ